MDAQQPRLARPGSATPLRVPLVPAYRQCTSPNSTHIAPLDLGSCTPAVQESSQLTISDLGLGSGFVKLNAIAGDSSTPADEADIGVTTDISDVRRKSDGSDYTGQVVVRAVLRQTDRANQPFDSSAATVEDAPLSIPIGCAATGGTGVGARCSLATTTDTLIPGFAKEGKRTVMSVLSLSVLDTAGQPFLTQGIFPP